VRNKCSATSSALGFEGQLGHREEAGQGHQHIVFAEREAGSQHPFQLEQDAHGDEQRRAFGNAAANEVLGSGKLRGIVLDQVANQDVGV